MQMPQQHLVALYLLLDAVASIQAAPKLDQFPCLHHRRIGSLVGFHSASTFWWSRQTPERGTPPSTSWTLRWCDSKSAFNVHLDIVSTLVLPRQAVDNNRKEMADGVRSQGFISSSKAEQAPFYCNVWCDWKSAPYPCVCPRPVLAKSAHSCMIKRHGGCFEIKNAGSTCHTTSSIQPRSRRPQWEPARHSARRVSWQRTRLSARSWSSSQPSRTPTSSSDGFGRCWVISTSTSRRFCSSRQTTDRRSSGFTPTLRVLRGRFEGASEAFTKVGRECRRLPCGAAAHPIRPSLQGAADATKNTFSRRKKDILVKTSKEGDDPIPSATICTVQNTKQGYRSHSDLSDRLAANSACPSQGALASWPRSDPRR